MQKSEFPKMRHYVSGFCKLGHICAIMEFCLHNGLTYKAIDDLLKLLQIICASPNKLPRSIFVLKKFFDQFTSMNMNTTEFAQVAKNHQKAVNVTSHPQEIC